jgi:hypothetical protein
MFVGIIENTVAIFLEPAQESTTKRACGRKEGRKEGGKGGASRGEFALVDL